ncbi:uncharacterized protein LOC121048689 [Ixodes scapularis]|uniref:uncharacterized protein LOC121048689 n=1 Tax=Ixodes scapularis TaxID=6945 RepID=UPI001AD691DD|nr:uncharacterized protein LOC121048689 [Ixodes scapularis]
MRYIADEPPALRSSAMVSRDMQLALAFKDSVNGIKGPSAMMNLPGFDLVTGYSVEYMHCVLQGVAKQVAELLFSSSNSNQHFYIGTAATLARVNARLLCIKPPHCITRLPRSLCERSYWKASEWRHWLLFYMLPCLQGILPVDYWKLLAKLCEAVHILLRDSIALHEIQQAELLLETFVGRSKTLFGVTSATFNVHQLLHLCNCVRQLGPLWAHSAFVFEGGNGRIVKLVSAARGLPDQILERVVMAQQVECLLATAKLPDREQDVCTRFLGFPPIQNASHVEGTCLLGCGSAVSLSAVEKRALEQHCDLPCTPGTEYERFVFDRKVFHSAAYTRPEKSNTTVVSTQDGEYYKIEKIILLSLPAQTCVLLCRPIVLMEESCMPPHIKECFLSESEALTVLQPSSIKDSCLYIDFVSENKSFVCDLPNSIERD